MITSPLRQEAFVSPVHKEVIAHLKEIEEADRQISNLISAFVTEYGTAFQNNNNRNAYLLNGTNRQAEINNILAHAMQATYPKQMTDLYNKRIEKYKLASEASVHALNSVQNNDRKSDSQFRLSLNKMNIATQEQQLELTKVFDKVGMKWERTESGIVYYTEVRK